VPTSNTTKPHYELERLVARPTYQEENEAFIRRLTDAGVCQSLLSRLDYWIENEEFIGDDVDPHVILEIAQSRLTPRRQFKAFDWIVACEITRLDLVRKAIEVFEVNPILLGNRWEKGCSSFEQSRFRDQAPYHHSGPEEWKNGRIPLNLLERISAEQSGTLDGWDRDYPAVEGDPQNRYESCKASEGKSRSDAFATCITRRAPRELKAIMNSVAVHSTATADEAGALSNSIARENPAKFSDQLRGYGYVVMKRDGFCCSYCGMDGSVWFQNWLQLTVDHLLPNCDPRREQPEFMVTTCSFCRGTANSFFEMAFSRGISFDGMAPQQIVNQRQQFVGVIRAFYEEFWTVKVEEP
jgi:hypothetical protein